MSYRVRLYCDDCTGVDFQGCFDGHTEVLLTYVGEERHFETRKKAEKAGDEATDDCAPWGYDVEPIPEPTK